MDTLQIQDAFEPYYSEKSTSDDGKFRAPAETARRATTLKTADLHSRLKIVRDRLASKIAQSR